MSSLSFVSSAVQTGTADGGYEETPIENKEVEAVNRRNAHKPLFEQLRQNQEEEQSKREEFQREIMRGTCTLDADDVAHLDAVRHQQAQREQLIQQQTQDELMQFRALKALRQQQEQEKSTRATVGVINDFNDLDNVIEDETDGGDQRGFGLIGRPKQDQDQSASSSGTSKLAELGVPTIKVKKRKRRAETSTADPSDNKNARTASSKAADTSSKKDKPPPNDSDTVEKVSSTSEKSNDLTIKTVEHQSKEKQSDNNSGGSGLNTLLAGYGSSSDED